MERTLAWFTDRLLTMSPQVKRELIESGVASDERISVIHLGLDLEPFLNAPMRRGQFRQEIGFRGEDKLVGIVGRFCPIKNHALFLESAARIAARDPAIRFVIVGDGNLRSALEQQCRQLGIADRVSFTGWRVDLARIYSDLDVLVVSSDGEGLPLPAIEAMAASCPVVATRVGDVPDLITDGVDGRLVPAKDAEAIADTIIDLLRHREAAKSIGLNAMASARERFDLTRLIEDVDHLYRELLSDKAIHLEPAESFRARA